MINDVTLPVRNKEYVRSFLFAMKINAPISRLHLITKIVSMSIVALILIRMFNVQTLDPLGCLFLLIFLLILLRLNGTLGWIFKSYLILLIPMMIGLFIQWMIFNPMPNTHILWKTVLYPGYIAIALSLPLIIAILAAYIFNHVAKRSGLAIVFGIMIYFLLNSLPYKLSLTLTKIELGNPYWLIISYQGLLVSFTKVLGYSALIFSTVILLTSTRDIEFVGLLHQLHVPFKVSFFLSMILRSLSTVMEDFGIVRQAQASRGVRNERSFISKLKDLAYLFIPLIIITLKRGILVGKALNARGFIMKANPTEFKEVQSLHLVDGIVVLISLISIYLVNGMGLNLTRLVGLGGILP